MICIKAAPAGPCYLLPRNRMSALNFKVLDVRPQLARGEEPFALIRTRVDALKPGEGVTVLAPFLPAPLIELLRSEGFLSTAEHHPNGTWQVNFWREK